MFFLFRIILSLFLFLVFAVIVATSFFSEAEYFEAPVFSFDEKNSSGALSYAWGTMQSNDLSIFETVLSSWETPEIDTQSWSLQIDITNTWKYFTSLRDLRRKYVLQGTWYAIEQEGIGEIFIDSETDTGKVFILSLNTPLKIKLTNEEWSEHYTDILLQPHMYIVFQPSRGSFLKNSDALRVQTVYTLWYLWNQVQDIQWDKVAKKYSEGEESFLQSAAAHILNRDKVYTQKLDLFLDQKVSQISGFTAANRYIHLFVNKQKKIAFYKNIILRGYSDIMNSKEYNTQLVSQVEKDLETLRELDTESYRELLLLKEDYMSLLYAFTGRDYISPKILFTLIGDALPSKDKYEFPLAGFSLFSYYDDNGRIERETEEIFLESFQKFTNLKSTSNSQKTLRNQYFSYFLQEQLLFILDGDGENFSMNSFIDILRNHTEVTKSFYDSEKNTRISTLYVFNDILTKVDSFLRTQYFKTERNTDGLLVYNSENRVTWWEVELLRVELEEIFDIYEQNKKFLSMTSSRDQAIVTWILWSKASLSEYLLALKNYESYVSEYDISKKNLLSLNTFWSDDTSLSDAKIRSYLNQFQEMSIENASIEVWKGFYKIKQAYIRWKIFNFTLYPDAANRIQDISVNSVASPFIYKLDIVESDWEEKYKMASIEEKDLYNFKKFFINTFFAKQTNKVEEFINIEAGPNEDKTEIVFKRDILLGDNGEFSVIKDVLPLEYKNIRVSKNEKLYDIFIEGAPLSLWKLSIWNISNYQAVMDGKYILNKEDHYFENIKLRVYSWTETNIKPVFWSTPIQISGRVSLTDFPWRIEEIFTHISAYSWQYSILNQDYETEGVVMQFSSRTKKMTFKFDLEWKSYNISVSGGNIDSIYRGTQKLTSKQIPFAEIDKYLQ